MKKEKMFVSYAFVEHLLDEVGSAGFLRVRVLGAQLDLLLLLRREIDGRCVRRLLLLLLIEHW
ncbi:hypothetical protein BpHYR1_005399 [Brachionus plicatilis]|uniref:Uncharacterized protein n=1 Tax=Brachionus plicatilis TaxID=10195 RepID=A0A3M7R0B5_BRAPC|nr:hypothetical protein BpHYR1_005399 [Brachionus plicatilis]